MPGAISVLARIIECGPGQCVERVFRVLEFLRRLFDPTMILPPHTDFSILYEQLRGGGGGGR